MVHTTHSLLDFPFSHTLHKDGQNTHKNQAIAPFSPMSRDCLRAECSELVED